MKLGIYRLHGLLDDRTMKQLESAYHMSIDVVSVYRAWNRCCIEDDLQWLEDLSTSSRDILLTWEPWKIPANKDRPFDQPDFSLKTIYSGQYDGYIFSYAKALKNFSQTVYLRPMHEMNGNWYPWCGTVNNNTPPDFIKAWKHLQAVFHQAGAHRLEWVWCPYHQSYPTHLQNTMETYFPGDDAIDWTGLDGYNWGATQQWSSWQCFDELFEPGYSMLNKLSKKPVMIGETACTETGGDKAQWITKAFQSLKDKFPRIAMLIWFDILKECDWQISSSQESLKAFQLKNISR
jgi:beta-mannanase